MNPVNSGTRQFCPSGQRIRARLARKWALRAAESDAAVPETPEVCYLRSCGCDCGLVACRLSYKKMRAGAGEQIQRAVQRHPSARWAHVRRSRPTGANFLCSLSCCSCRRSAWWICCGNQSPARRYGVLGCISQAISLCAELQHFCILKSILDVKLVHIRLFIGNYGRLVTQARRNTVESIAPPRLYTVKPCRTL